MESNLLPVVAVGTPNSFETPAFVLVNYNPKLGEFTNTWDMVNDDGDGLHIDMLHFSNNKTSTLSAPMCILEMSRRHSPCFPTYFLKTAIYHKTIVSCLILKCCLANNHLMD